MKAAMENVSKVLRLDEVDATAAPPDGDSPRVDLLPPGSWLLEFQFQLAKPVITKDEIVFPLDNPVRRERASRLPIVAASSWKGALRGAFYAMRSSGIQVDAEDLERMFGGWDEPTEHRDFTRGRLQFFSTVFTMEGHGEVVEKYVTQSLSRRTKTGKVPVEYETIARGAIGTFRLLYCTYADGWENTAGIEAESSRHLGLAAAGVAVMLRETGFGGKKSSGFGEVRNELRGNGRLVWRDWTPVVFETLDDLERGFEAPHA
jgi:CRISPR-associated protein Cmr2